MLIFRPLVTEILREALDIAKNPCYTPFMLAILSLMFLGWIIYLSLTDNVV